MTDKRENLIAGMKAMQQAMTNPTDPKAGAMRERELLYTPATYWSDELQCIVVPVGACPYPIKGDDGSAECCIERGQCGCDAQPGRYDCALHGLQDGPDCPRC